VRAQAEVQDQAQLQAASMQAMANAATGG